MKALAKCLHLAFLDVNADRTTYRTEGDPNETQEQIFVLRLPPPVSHKKFVGYCSIGSGTKATTVLQSLSQKSTGDFTQYQ